MVSLALAQYIGYIGPPPLAVLRDSELMSEYFDSEGTADLESCSEHGLTCAGNWVMTEAPIPETSLEDFVTVIPPGREKGLFLGFIRKMLTWDQEARRTTKELLEDEWLKTYFDSDQSDQHGLIS